MADLRRRVVGTGSCLWSQLLPVAVMGGRKDHARSASFWSGYQGRQVDEAAGLGLLSGSI